MARSRNKRKSRVASGLLLGLLLAVLAGCGSGQKQDESKVPVEVKKAEMADSTRLDSAPDSTTAADSLAGEDSARKKKLRFR